MRQVLGGVVVAGAGDFGHLVNRARFAKANSLSIFQRVAWPRAVASRCNSSTGKAMAVLVVSAGRRGGIHNNQPKSLGIACKMDYAFLKLERKFIQLDYAVIQTDYALVYLDLTLVQPDYAIVNLDYNFIHMQTGYFGRWIWLSNIWI